MKTVSGLNRQLVLSMSAVTGLALVAMIAGMTVFYALLFEFEWGWDLLDSSPDAASWPSPIEWAAYGLFALLGLAGASLAAMRFAKRLIRPLDAVAIAARNIARGNLAARAITDNATFEETKQLVTDFNIMANQLEHAEKEARTWNAAIAHELRTPLTILRGRLQGFADGIFAPDKRAFQALIGQVDSLTRIVEDLNLLTLAQSGRLNLQIDVIDIAQEAAKVIDLVAPACQAAGLSIDSALHKVEVMGDGARVRQVLFALLNNARQHASPGRVRVETKMTAGDQAVLSVSDEGPGFPFGTEASAFEPFWRADESRSRSSGGSGLGLAVVKAIAEAHGGVALARPAHPKGAIVEIHLPMKGFISGR